MEPLTSSRVVALVPGAFKPPHKGHLAMVSDYAARADEVIILVSPVTRGGVSADQSIALWNLYLESLPHDNIKVLRSPVNSPVLAAYQFVENVNDNPDWAQPGDTVLMGVSTKEGDQKRFCNNVQKYARKGVVVSDECAVAPEGEEFTHPVTGEPLSASDFREVLGNPEEILNFIPRGSQDRIGDIQNILMTKETKEIEEAKVPITLENLFNMVEEVIEEEELEEISAMGGAAGAVGNGAIQGYSLPLGAKPRKTNKKKRRKGRRIYIPD